MISIQLSAAALKQMRKRIYNEMKISHSPSDVIVESKLRTIALNGLSQNRAHLFDQELRRRKFALFIYLIRSPLFERFVLIY